MSAKLQWVRLVVDSQLFRVWFFFFFFCLSFLLILIFVPFFLLSIFPPAIRNMLYLFVRVAPKDNIHSS